MGAFIAFLHLTGKSKNFFVLAPNTTIYDKLVEDFSRQSSPKYVFRGISEFAQRPPIIVTGDNWQDGRGVRGSDLFGDEAIVNIFNVDKINKDKGKIRGFRETLGASYYDYLAGLPERRYRCRPRAAECSPIAGAMAPSASGHHTGINTLVRLVRKLSVYFRPGFPAYCCCLEPPLASATLWAELISEARTSKRMAGHVRCGRSGFGVLPSLRRRRSSTTVMVKIGSDSAGVSAMASTKAARVSGSS